MLRLFGRQFENIALKYCFSNSDKGYKTAWTLYLPHLRNISLISWLVGVVHSYGQKWQLFSYFILRADFSIFCLVHHESMKYWMSKEQRTVYFFSLIWPHSEMVWFSGRHINLACRKPTVCPVLRPPRWSCSPGVPKPLSEKACHSSGCSSLSCHVTPARLLKKKYDFFALGQCGLVGWASSRALRGLRFDSRPGLCLG